MNYMRRLDKQIKWHDISAVQYGKRHTKIKIANITCAVLISICSITSLVFSIRVMPVFIAVLAGTITFLENYSNLKQYDRLHILYRVTWGKLQTEKINYEMHLTPYNKSDMAVNIKALTANCEKILKEENMEWQEYKRRN